MGEEQVKNQGHATVVGTGGPETAAEVRDAFIAFFEDRGHVRVASSPVRPPDPTLLFTNAGMNQFKDIFLGTGSRDYDRAVNSQKCIRAGGKHNDLEEVGRDGTHHTFFEMLGNWSFGDYYKPEAIAWAWELLTEVYGLNPDVLYATVHDTDEEAAVIWRDEVGLPADRVLSFGDDENFWEMADTGPCGPCSELHIDLGPGTCPKARRDDHLCAVNREGCDRYVEIWNLVFIQYERAADGSLSELPAKHVDTGMGLERIAAVIEGHASNYRTSLFQPVWRALESIVEELEGEAAAEAEALRGTDEWDVTFRVISDHVRCLVVAITDGILPSNVGRGYVLRRILRRAARFGRKLGIREPFLHRLVPAVVEILGDPFPVVADGADRAAGVIESEEEAFDRTIDRGLRRFREEVERVRERGDRIIPGEVAWDLYQTEGFPFDLTRLMAEEEGLGVDEETFRRLLQEEAERARRRAGEDTFFTVVESLETGRASTFTGHGRTVDEGAILEGSAEDGYVVLDRTPFYAEAGGQVGDIGRIYSDDLVFRVDDTQKHGDVIVHIGELEEGDPGAIREGAEVRAEVDSLRRDRIRKHHTGTHILHWALRERLGEHATQQGSLVAPDRLRFDFAHPDALDRDDIEGLERMVHDRILADDPVTDREEDFDEARAEGAMALFGEKYGDVVRVVQVGDYSLELCGGTHVDRSGEIGPFRITSEGAIQAGVRRVEAVCGLDAVRRLQDERRLVEEAAGLLKTRPEQVPDRIRSLQEQVKDLEREVERARAQRAASRSDEILDGGEEIEGVRVICERTDEGLDTLRRIGDAVKSEGGPAVAFLAGVRDGKTSYVAAASDPAVERGLKAGDLMREAADAGGGSGGGRPDLAQGGGGDAEKAVEAARAWVRERLEG